ncbi:MAG: hypothetical protein QME51_08665 [Planctomycetota bacterium]|nr:hypothetical protein [Planctomycetota bacterium]
MRCFGVGIEVVVPENLGSIDESFPLSVFCAQGPNILAQSTTRLDLKRNTPYVFNCALNIPDELVILLPAELRIEIRSGSCLYDKKFITLYSVKDVIRQIAMDPLSGFYTDKEKIKSKMLCKKVSHLKGTDFLLENPLKFITSIWLNSEISDARVEIVALVKIFHNNNLIGEDAIWLNLSKKNLLLCQYDTTLFTVKQLVDMLGEWKISVDIDDYHVSDLAISIEEKEEMSIRKITNAAGDIRSEFINWQPSNDEYQEVLSQITGSRRSGSRKQRSRGGPSLDSRTPFFQSAS